MKINRMIYQIDFKQIIGSNNLFIFSSIYKEDKKTIYTYLN